MSDWMFAMSRYENDVRDAERNIDRRRALRERRQERRGSRAGAAIADHEHGGSLTGRFGASRPAGA